LSSDDIVCDSNLTFNLQNVDPVLSTQERGSGMLDLYITVSGDNKVIQNNVAINSTNLPIIPPTDIVNVKILTPDDTPNSIVVSDNQCDQYIPIVAIASTGNEHTKLNQKYKYIFSANNPNVSIEPESGIFYLSDPYTKISSVLKLNNEPNCNLSIKCYSDETSINPTYDAVSILCIDSCNLSNIDLYDSLPSPSLPNNPTIPQIPRAPASLSASLYFDVVTSKGYVGITFQPASNDDEGITISYRIETILSQGIADLYRSNIYSKSVFDYDPSDNTYTHRITAANLGNPVSNGTLSIRVYAIGRNGESTPKSTSIIYLVSS
jgi:hypothetical protein